MSQWHIFVLVLFRSKPLSEAGAPLRKIWKSIRGNWWKGQIVDNTPPRTQKMIEHIHTVEDRVGLGLDTPVRHHTFVRSFFVYLPITYSHRMLRPFGEIRLYATFVPDLFARPRAKVGRRVKLRRYAKQTYNLMYLA